MVDFRFKSIIKIGMIGTIRNWFWLRCCPLHRYFWSKCSHPEPVFDYELVRPFLLIEVKTRHVPEWEILRIIFLFLNVVWQWQWQNFWDDKFWVELASPNNAINCLINYFLCSLLRLHDKKCRWNGYHLFIHQILNFIV